MNEFSLAGLVAQMMANRLLTVSIASLIVAIVLAAIYWDTVCYFCRRVWHATPLIGTVARMARQVRDENGAANANGWRNAEINLCDEYLTRYLSVSKDPEYFKKCEDYLAKVGEKGRRTKPFWVIPLMALLLVLEAVGFAYVIGPFVNREISSDNLQFLTWSVATFLALISGFLAHIAGHQIHQNSLVKKARHWWRGTDESKRDELIGKDIGQISIENSFNDTKGHGYNQIIARINTNEDVTVRHGWIYGFGVVIMLVAIAAFWVRTEQLNALEVDLVSDMKSEQVSKMESSSPFELPKESADVARDSVNQSVDDKIGAEHRASLVTFGILSIVYVAIQFIALWLSLVFGFAGLSSYEAYAMTSRFQTSDEMIRWMERQRNLIAGHANHKLRMLQRKVAKMDMSSGGGETSNKNAAKRDFLAFVQIKQLEEQDRIVAQDASNRSTAKRLRDNETAISADSKSYEVASSPVVESNTVKSESPAAIALNFDDLRSLEIEELETLVDVYDLSIDQLTKIRSTQVALTKVGKFPAKAGETA